MLGSTSKSDWATLVVRLVLLAALVPVDSFADRRQELADLIRDCQRPGNTLKAIGERVIDFGQLMPAADETHSFCIRDYSCSIPSENIIDYKGQIGCGLNSDGVCEGLAECGRNITRNVNFGFAPPALKSEAGYVPKTGRHCRELKRGSPSMVYSMFLKSKTESDYRTMCVKTVECILPSGVKEEHPHLACPTTGKKGKLADGSTTDECYGPNECFDNQLPLPSEKEYREYLANKLKLASEKTSATQPRNSQTVSQPSASAPSASNHTKRGP